MVEPPLPPFCQYPKGSSFFFMDILPKLAVPSSVVKQILAFPRFMSRVIISGEQKKPDKCAGIIYVLATGSLLRASPLTFVPAGDLS